MNKNNQLKKKILTAIFFMLLAVYSYGQQGYTQTATIKGRGNAPDTIVRKKTELSFNKTFNNNYKREESIVQALRPYMVSDIVNPTNVTHPVYLQRARDARETLPQAKAELIEVMKKGVTSKELMARVGIVNEADLNAIKFVFLPVYYITPNIVFFKNGDNIAKYYNLGTGAMKYLMLRNDEPVGYLDFWKNRSAFKSTFYRISPNELESYRKIVKLGKKPVGIRQSIFTDPDQAGGESVFPFGYVEQGHLVFSYYEEGVIQQAGIDQHVAPNPRFCKTYTLETAESFFSGSGNHSIISTWLESTVNHLKASAPRR